MKRVVMIGSTFLAKQCLEKILLTNKEIEIAGIICQPKYQDPMKRETVYSFCQKYRLPMMFKLSNCASLKELDLGLSINNSEIISTETIAQFSLGVVNTHGGILPEYRGSYTHVNAMINKEPRLGATLHYVDEGIDTGDIIDWMTFPNLETYTAWTAFEKVQECKYELLKINLPKIIAGTNPRIAQKKLLAAGRTTNTYYSKRTMEMKNIPYEKIPELVDRIRIFDSPVHEPAYTVLNGNKIFLRS